jgi:hypothetical protein
MGFRKEHLVLRQFGVAKVRGRGHMSRGSKSGKSGIWQRVMVRWVDGVVEVRWRFGGDLVVYLEG